LVTAEG